MNYFFIRKADISGQLNINIPISLPWGGGGKSLKRKKETLNPILSSSYDSEREKVKKLADD